MKVLSVDHFLKRLFLFLVFPVLFFVATFSVPFYVAYSSRELLHINEMIAIQQKNPDVIINTVLQGTDTILKYKVAHLIKPDILALGTSRVMCFREEMFADGLKFYNAGRAVRSTCGFLEFIDNLGYNPKILIIGLDQNFFNEKWAQERNKKPDYLYCYRPQMILIKALEKLVGFSIDLSSLKNFPDNIGLNAVVYNDGFRKDGSYYYSRIINFPDSTLSKRSRFPFGDVVDRINSGDSWFAHGNDLYGTAVAQISQFLEMCRKKNIFVVGIIPPYAPYVYSKMKESKDFGYMEKVYPALLPIFSQYNYELYDYTDSKKISDDSMYNDGCHGNDDTYYNILLSLKAGGSLIGEYINEEKAFDPKAAH